MARPPASFLEAGMRVRMTRTVRVADRVEPFEIGMEYELPDQLAEAWIAYGVCDAVEADLPADPDDPGPVPAIAAETPDAPVRARVKKEEA